MRVVTEKFETITEYDLTAGKLYPNRAVKEDAEPIDNVTKFAWTDEDYEDVQMYIPNQAPAAPHKLDVIEAQVAYTAMMTDTLLEV